MAGCQTPGATKDCAPSSPTQFIADAVKGIAASGAAGVNLDWEPYAKGMTKWTPGDGDGVRADNLKGGVAIGSASASVEPLHRTGWVMRPGPPSPQVLNADGFLYAEFLDKFGKARHGAGPALRAGSTHRTIALEHVNSPFVPFFKVGPARDRPQALHVAKLELSLDFFSNLAVCGCARILPSRPTPRC